MAAITEIHTAAPARLAFKAGTRARGEALDRARLDMASPR
jgi:hypothetical protein